MLKATSATVPGWQPASSTLGVNGQMIFPRHNLKDTDAANPRRSLYFPTVKYCTRNERRTAAAAKAAAATPWSKIFRFCYPRSLIWASILSTQSSRYTMVTGSRVGTLRAIHEELGDEATIHKSMSQFGNSRTEHLFLPISVNSRSTLALRTRRALSSAF